MLTETTTLAQTKNYPRFCNSIPTVEMRDGRYLMQFAKSPKDFDRVLKLRFDVFNLELGEGLDSSFQTSRDFDQHDLVCHHLMIVEALRGEVVGTYRLQTGAMASTGMGFYSAGEFDLSHLPVEVLEDAVELGRACISREHRNTLALFLLWKGIAAYVAHNRKRFIFGCCSLTSQNAQDGWQAMNLLEKKGNLHPTFSVDPKKGFECEKSDLLMLPGAEANLPKLFRTYLRFGAKVCGPPAIDRLFKTIDFFVMFDIFQMDEQAQRLFFDVPD